MPYDPKLHHRKSIRWKAYDYSSRGLYFVTVCTHRRMPILSRIEHRKVVLTSCGEIVRAGWCAIPQRFPSIEVGPFVVMPSHLHGILAIISKTEKEGAASSAPTIGEIIRAFKSLSAQLIHSQCGTAGQVWQRNYYEHVIREGRDHRIISRYIWENPARWQWDPENSASKAPDATLPWEQFKTKCGP